MWSVVAIFVCIIVLFWTYMAISAQKHERAEKAQLKKELDDAKEKLQKALNEHPGDFLLHDALGDRVRRLQEQLNG
jgi:predicted metal-dependent phosphoesterase TrpH